MENNKKKFTVEIVGDTMTLITDESDDFVREVASRLNKRMMDLTRNNFRITKYDAAVLCALDAMSEKIKAEKRVRTVESQLSVAQLEIKKLREQLEAAQSAPSPAPAPEAVPMPAVAAVGPHPPPMAATPHPHLFPTHPTAAVRSHHSPC